VGRKNQDRAHFLGILCGQDAVISWCPRKTPSTRKKFKTNPPWSKKWHQEIRKISWATPRGKVFGGPNTCFDVSLECL